MLSAIAERTEDVLGDVLTALVNALDVKSKSATGLHTETHFREYFRLNKGIFMNLFIKFNNLQFFYEFIK
jgi:hypothetical protein